MDDLVLAGDVGHAAGEPVHPRRRHRGPGPHVAVREDVGGLEAPHPLARQGVEGVDRVVRARAAHHDQVPAGAVGGKGRRRPAARLRAAAGRLAEGVVGPLQAAVGGGVEIDRVERPDVAAVVPTARAVVADVDDGAVPGVGHHRRGVDDPAGVEAAEERAGGGVDGVQRAGVVAEVDGVAVHRRRRAELGPRGVAPDPLAIRGVDRGQGAVLAALVHHPLAQRGVVDHRGRGVGGVAHVHLPPQGQLRGVGGAQGGLGRGARVQGVGVEHGPVDTAVGGHGGRRRRRRRNNEERPHDQHPDPQTVASHHHS